MCPVTPCLTSSPLLAMGSGTAGPALFQFVGVEVGNAEPGSVGRAGSHVSAPSKLRVGAEEHTREKAHFPL